MPVFYRVVFAAVLSLCSAVVWCAQADRRAMESSWLELVKGYRGDAMGVELMDIEKSESDASRKVTVAIPKSAMGNPDEIEEVLVVGRAPQKAAAIPLPNVSYEWVRDYDKDNHGLIIHLGEGDNWPIRLYMNSAPGYTE